MKKFELPLLVVIAICALFLGGKLAESLFEKNDHVQVIPLDAFEDFVQKQDAFIKTSELNKDGDKDTVYSDQRDLYLSAKQWEWYPDLEVKPEGKYLLHIASADVQHSFHLESAATGTKIDILIQPGKEYIIELKNLKSGAYAIGCTEYCGIQHNKMRGRLIVR